MFDSFKNIYLVGIGGIGMSALARWFNTNGYFVAGYDRTSTKLCQELENEGIEIHYEDDISKIPVQIIQNPSEQTLVIYTPAIPKNHVEFDYLKEKDFLIKKRAEVLGMLTANHFTIAVAGTHGKTTTSSMIAHILKSAGYPSNAFLGGILKNYQSNLLLNTIPGKDPVMVVEADEYDKSFLQLNPSIAVVLSTDADHLDIYGDAENVSDTYAEFAKKTKENGSIFLKKGINLKLGRISPTIQVEYFALNEFCDYFAENIRIEGDIFYFDFIAGKEKIEEIKILVPGFHNVENAVLAISVALRLGIDKAQIKEAIGTYQGVRRRFDYISRGSVVYIDDYAHHPTEITAFLKSVRALYQGKKITAVFQPHLYSRTRDFLEGFAESLSIADEPVLLEIYPARELPIEGVNSENLLKKVNLENKKLVPKNELLKELEGRELEILVTIGAGDIDQYVDEIKQMIYAKQNTAITQN